MILIYNVYIVKVYFTWKPDCVSVITVYKCCAQWSVSVEMIKWICVFINRISSDVLGVKLLYDITQPVACIGHLNNQETVELKLLS